MTPTSHRVERRDQVVIRFAGDSGDGMQMTGDRFAVQTATLGNNLSTQPDYPAEIRAPAGTVAGVSSYQVKFADHEVLTAGDPEDIAAPTGRVPDGSLGVQRRVVPALR